MFSQFLQDQSIQNQPLKLIYQYIYQSGAVSRADIIQHTNLNRGKVARSLMELLEKEYIQEVGHADSGGGRPPVLYQINPLSSYIIGVQITRFKTTIVLFDLLLNRLSERIMDMTSSHTPKMVIEVIKNTIMEYMDTYGFTTDDMLGIGIGAIGPLDRTKGIVLQSEPYLTQRWENIPIVHQLKQYFPVLVEFDNAANTIVLGEFQKHPMFKNILNVTVGWTIGCGVILEGQLLKVESGDISGYGHTIIDMDGKACFCGKRGCMTAYASFYSILDRINEKSPVFYHQQLEDLSPMSQVHKIVSQHDVEIEGVILDSAKYIGVGVANLATVFHSELILVNGPLINEYPGYFDEIIRHVSLNLNDPKNIQFSTGNINESGVVGAAVQILKQFIK